MPLPAVLGAAAAEDLSVTAALERLLAIEVDATQARRLAGRLRFACLPTPATLEDFDPHSGPDQDSHDQPRADRHRPPGGAQQPGGDDEQENRQHRRQEHGNPPSTCWSSCVTPPPAPPGSTTPRPLPGGSRSTPDRLIGRPRLHQPQ